MLFMINPRASLEARLREHERQVALGLRARVAWVASSPHAVFRYHEARYFEHYWDIRNRLRQWTLWPNEVATFTDVTDQVPSLLADLLTPWEGRVDRWLSTLIRFLPQIGALKVHAETDGPAPGLDVTWSIKEPAVGGCLWGIDGSVTPGSPEMNPELLECYQRTLAAPFYRALATAPPSPYLNQNGP